MNEDSIAAVLEAFVKNMLMNVNTCFPGVIQSYENGRATVAPSVVKVFDDGDTLPYPIIPDARVIWPSFSNGIAGIKGSVRVGDPCLVLISQHPIDGSLDPRMHDLQDAYALMCDLGSARGGATNNSDLIVYNGKASIVLKENGQILLNAPAGIIADVSSSTATIKGTVTQSGGSMSSNGIVVDSHVHGGVSSGGSTTSGPR